jgi:hypothetical protein
MPVFQFNRSTNSLNLFGNNNGIIPRVGINFGNSRLARGIGGLFSKKGKQKGHPGSNGQEVGRGVRRIKNLFESRDSINAISIEKWDYGNPEYSSKSHPPGFTPPYAFLFKKDGGASEKWKPFEKYGLGVEIEITMGNQPMAFKQDNFDKNYLLRISNSLSYRKYVLGLRDPSTKKFTFDLNKNDQEYNIDHTFKIISDNNYETHAGLQSPKSTIPLTSFTEVQENEDPTILGFDIEIDEVTSPLFNGAVGDFIQQYSSASVNQITEIASRREIYQKFINQFKKFFRTNVNFQQASNFDQNIKNHYITQITGLDKFSHVKGEETGSEGPKLFTNFPSDKIDLLINEDVEQNISYLSYLYNLLTRSRIEGRRIIPQNLLRFNCRITVTEIRNYNRVIKESPKPPSPDLVEPPQQSDDQYKVLSDLISKKEYNLYECEFSFNKLTHGNQINMGATLTQVGPITISFNYKFVSSEFHKFEFNPVKEPYFTKQKFNDEFFNPRQLTSLDTGRALILNPEGNSLGATQASFTGLSSISFLDPIQNVLIIDNYPRNGYPLNDQDKSPLGKAKLRNFANSFVGGLVRNLVGNVLRAGADAINREINSRFALVNKAINERLSRAGLQISLNTIQNPRNVYNPSNSRNRLRDDLNNAIRGFVGRSTGRFFSKPVNTAEANNGFISQRAGGPFRSSSIYRPVPNRNINRIRSSRLTSPRNVYTPRRISNFLSSTNPRINPVRTRTARSNPFFP